MFLNQWEALQNTLVSELQLFSEDALEMLSTRLRMCLRKHPLVCVCACEERYLCHLCLHNETSSSTIFNFSVSTEKVVF